MAIPTRYSFTRYLAAKKSVDDRALNRRVLNSLSHSLSASTPEAPLNVLEVGAGIGTMVERLLEWGLLTNAIYTAIDAETENIQEANRRLPAWAADHGFVATECQGQLCLHRGKQELMVRFEAVDFFDFAACHSHRSWELLIAHAFLDLINVPTTLPRMLSLLRPGGLFYFSIVFDGATILQPGIDMALDGQIESLYHQTMDTRMIAGTPCGDSRAGRHLFSHLRAAGAQLLDMGGSDWVVFSSPTGYPGDEAYFLHFIIHTIWGALNGHPDLDSRRFADWIARRQAQIEEGSLLYVAHQLDFLGRVPEPAILAY